MKSQKRLITFGMARLAIGVIGALSLSDAAGASFTATGWVIDVPVQGIWCSNGLGRIDMRGNAHVVRVECPSDARLTGRRVIFMNGATQTDGSSLLFGAAYQEVGTWDTTGTNFTATGGMWETTYRGTMSADGSLQLHSVGTGWSGAIDGLRLDETLMREAGAVLDPALPYHTAGTLQPAAVDTNLVLDDFTNPPAANWTYYGPPDSYSYTRVDGQLVVSGYWPGVITRQTSDSYTMGVPAISAWSVPDGQTLETRVDLVNLNDSATSAILMLGTTSGFYSLNKGHSFVRIHKWSPNLPWGPIAIFSFENVQVPDTNVILSLALTTVNTSVVVIARVLDKSDPPVVLYAHSVVDTPGQDPTLTWEEYFSLSGMNLTVHPDLVEAPFTTARAGVGVFQYNSDGQQPAAVAVFDNLELRKYDIPPLGIARAVQLSWPDVRNYAVESAASPQGPWLPVSGAALPGMKQMTVPINTPAQFFRLRQAP